MKLTTYFGLQKQIVIGLKNVIVCSQVMPKEEMLFTIATDYLSANGFHLDTNKAVIRNDVRRIVRVAKLVATNDIDLEHGFKILNLQ